MGSSSVVILVILAVLCYICWSFPVPCYFQEYHNKINRDVFPTQSKAKSNCGGDVMTLQEVNKKFEVSPKFLFGAKHVADLILIRTGDFVNWNDKEESRDALSRKICTNHLDELFNKFDKKATKHVKYFHKCEKDVPGCSLPQFISGHHSGQNRVPVNHLTKAESEAVFKTTHQLVQTGIPLCQSCKSWAVDKLKQYQGRKICEEQQTCFTDLNKEIEVDNTCDNDAGNNNGANDIGADGGDFVDDFDDAGDEDYIPPSKAPSDSSPGKQELLTFAHAVGMDTGFGLVGRKPFTSLTRQSQRKKTKGGKILYNEMCSLIAPGSEKVLKQDICLDEMDGWIPNKSTKREEFLRNLSVLYESETDKEFKLHYLSHMVPLVSYVELHQYVKVSPYYYNKATAYALNPRITKIPHIGYERWNDEQLNPFIRFITSSIVVTGLPYKSKTVELSTGEIIDIPSLLRLQRSEQIIELYIKKMESEGKRHLILPKSTMYKILKSCVATKTKSLKCVDYYLVDAGEAVDKLIGMVAKWEAEDILTSYETKVLKNRVQESFRYLRTDFPLSLNFTSATTSHCIKNALSSPNEIAFSGSCAHDDTHQHTQTCTRCSSFKELMRDLVSIAKTRMTETPSTASVARKREVEDDVVKVETYVDKLEEYRKHVIKSVYSRHTWRNIVENLNDETALLTLDWAQKLEPQYHRESQAKYFGKKGINYHIVHVLVKFENILAEHTFVHIIESGTQKSFEVLAILDDVVAELKKMGVKKFIARSDNAGCYRSTEIIMGLRKIEEKNDVKIIRWTFSEVQAGKSSCDRKAGVVKSRVEEYVSQKNDVATANQFFQALTTPYDIPYMTITQASIKPSGKAKVAGFPNIQLYTDYTILDDGVIAYKATNIGKGLKISNEKYKDKIEIANMEVKIWTSPSAGGDVTKNTEASFISRGQKAKFWNTIRDPLVQRKSVEDPKAFPCPEESCEEKFLTVEELEAHIETGNHTVREPERLTLRDRALKLYQQCANELLEETNELSAAQLTFCATANVNDETSEESDFFEGNALRTGKKKCNSITEKARNFIKKLYDQGEKDSSQKISHEKAVEMMEAAKDPKDPSLPLFRATELLTSQQINGLFTRFKKGSASTTDKKRKHEEDEENFDENNCDDGEEDDDEGEEEEATPPAKRPRRVTRRRGLKNRLQAEEEREIEEIRKEARRAALETF